MPPGRQGEVVVTPLSDSGMALFRYRIGDRGHLQQPGCPCGSLAKTLLLAGRTAQSFNVDGWTISTDNLIGALTRLGMHEAEPCQLQVLWDFPSYRVRLLVTPNAPAGLSTDRVIDGFAENHQLTRMLTSARCTAFSVERAVPQQFARTERDKVPVLYQRFD
jgi:phenylacetate-CoA ligase